MIFPLDTSGPGPAWDRTDHVIAWCGIVAIYGGLLVWWLAR